MDDTSYYSKNWENHPVTGIQSSTATHDTERPPVCWTVWQTEKQIGLQLTLPGSLWCPQFCRICFRINIPARKNRASVIYPPGRRYCSPNPYFGLTVLHNEHISDIISWKMCAFIKYWTTESASTVPLTPKRAIRNCSNKVSEKPPRSFCLLSHGLLCLFFDRTSRQRCAAAGRRTAHAKHTRSEPLSDGRKVRIFDAFRFQPEGTIASCRR